jgi:tRNA pseudouridine32 synthase/23S rRNA pseudouridine746 synthase
MSIETKKITFTKIIDKEGPFELLEFLKPHIDLSVGQIKEALVQGSCWVKKGNSKTALRVRRAKSIFRAGDRVEFNYDAELFARQKAGLESEPILIKDAKSWSAWLKPAGCLAQGTKFGDALSMVRFAEKNLNREVFLTGRLDRETVGLMVLAHNKKMSRTLSDAWSTPGKVTKTYEAMVKGVVEQDEGVIDLPLEGKKAVTHFKVLKRANHWSILELNIKTGRTHQIRKHLTSLGHPVLGDSRYGEGNKNKTGLQLVATSLSFKLENETIDLKVPDDVRLIRV